MKQFVDQNFKTLGQLAVPELNLDNEASKLCQGTKMDVEVIERVNENMQYMKREE